MTALLEGEFDPKRRIGSNVVVLELDTPKAFPNDEAVSEALSLILKSKKSQKGQKQRGKKNSTDRRSFGKLGGLVFCIKRTNEQALIDLHHPFHLGSPIPSHFHVLFRLIEII